MKKVTKKEVLRNASNYWDRNGYKAEAFPSKESYLKYIEDWYDSFLCNMNDTQYNDYMKYIQTMHIAHLKQLEKAMEDSIKARTGKDLSIGDSNEEK